MSTEPTIGGEEVHCGRDGWLFLIGGSNSVLSQYRRSWRTWLHYRRWSRILRRRARHFQGLGIRYAHVVVPEKLTVYDHMAGALRIDVATAPAVQLGRRLGRSPTARAWVDLVAPLRARRDAEALYLRTDSHWSHAGCFRAYEVLCRHLGATPRADLEEGRFLRETEICGDLGSKLAPARGETVRLHGVQRDSVRVYASDLVRAYEARGQDVHRGAHVVFRNDSPDADPRRLVLFGDSYANFVWGLASGMLTGLLAETFREVHFLWSVGVDKAYVAEVRPDIVVTEIAERFVGALPRREDRRKVVEEKMRALEADVATAKKEAAPGGGS